MLSIPSPRSASVSPRARRSPVSRNDWWLAVVIAVSLAGFTWIGAWRPVFWLDENVTHLVVRKSLPEIVDLVADVDLVHAAYYFLLHGWVAVFGHSEGALRTPSAIAVGLTASTVFAIGHRLRSRSFGIVAALTFAVLPVTTNMAVDARPRALGTLIVTLTVLAFILALHGQRRSLSSIGWTAYALLGGLAVVVNVYDALVLVGIGVTVIVLLRCSRIRRRTAAAWMLHTGVTMLCVAPFLLLAAKQTGQVSWIPPLRLVDVPARFLVSQWFPQNAPAALVAWSLVLIGVVALVRGLRRRPPLARRATTSFPPEQDVLFLALVLPWLIAPSAVMVAVTLTGHLFYTPRYPFMSAPALALLIALGLTALTARLRTVVGVVLMLACLASWWSPRFVDDRDDWRAAGAALTEQRGANPGSGGIIWGADGDFYEQLGEADPCSVAGLRDLSASRKSPTKAGERIWPAHVSADESAARAESLDAVWFVGDDGADLERVERALTSNGFRRTADSEFRSAQAEDGVGVVVTFVR